MTGPNDHDEGQPAITMNLFGRQLRLLLGAIGGRWWIASAHNGSNTISLWTVSKIPWISWSFRSPSNLHPGWSSWPSLRQQPPSTASHIPPAQPNSRCIQLCS